MKTSIKVVLVAIGFSFFSLTSYAVNKIENNLNDKVIVVDAQGTTVKGVYKGHDDSGYNFSIVDRSGKESVVTFQKGDESILKANDLASDAAIGKTFEITYSTTSKKALDSNGEEVMEEVRTIKGLKPLR